MKKKIFIILMTVILVISLCSCADTPPDVKDPETPDISSDGITTLRIAYPFEKDSPDYQLFQDAVKELSKKYPNIIIEYYEDDPYNVDESDIFFFYRLANLPQFSDTGYVYNMQNHYREIKYDLDERLITPLIDSGYVCGFPSLYNVYVLFVNNKLVNKASCDTLPKRYEDFLRCMRSLKTQGIAPIGCSESDVRILFDMILGMCIGSETMTSIFKGQRTWDNDGVVRAADIFLNMVSDGLIHQSSVNLSHDEVLQNFINGEYAVFVGSTKDICELTDETKHPGFSDSLYYSFFPGVDPEAEYRTGVVAEPMFILSVPESSDKKELASEYASELSHMISDLGYFGKLGIPVWYFEENGRTVPEIQDLIRKDFIFEAHDFSMSCFALMDWEELDTYSSCVDQLLRGSLTSDEFVEKLYTDIG